MVSSLCFSPVFLPSLGDPAEQSPTAAEDTSTISLFDGLMADPRFEELRQWFLDGPAAGETPVEFTPGLGNHPVAIVLFDAPSDDCDTESTMVIPVIDADTHEIPAVKLDPEENRDHQLWLPDVGDPAHPRQHA